MLAGELDSPIPPRQLEEFRSRPACHLEQVLKDRVSPGQLLVAVDEGPLGWVERFLARRARDHEEGQGPAPVWLRGWALDFSGDPRDIMEQYFRRIGVQRPPGSPRFILLERPDLATIGSVPVEGVQLRSILMEWAGTFSDDWLLVVVGPTSFVAHDPYPGALLFRVTGESGSAAGQALVDDAAFRDFVPREPLPRQRARAALEVLRDGSDRRAQAAFAAFYELLAAMPRGSGLDERFFYGRDADALRPHRTTLESWLRSLVRQELEDLEDPSLALRRSARRDARVASRLYALLDAIASPDECKTTFVGCDVGSWFCFLRAFGYEQLAVVLCRMERETLAGVNLMHAPPLAFGRFRRADFSSSDLYRVDLSSCDLREACFSGADLSRAHLKRADLRGADLRRADMSYSSLELVDLRGADLAGANLDRCIDTYAVRDN